ncbi:Cu,Zn superoxide dismutase-like protein, partial [Aureobasidium namibiae CBS 147.97]
KTVAAIAVLATAVTAQSDTTPVTGKLGNATVQSNNPAGVAYIATLSATSKSNISGNVLALTSSDNTGVNFQIALTGLPSEGGPFLYHIHDYPVPSDGNCTSTGAHVDPFVRGEAPPCDASLPETCQVGDLSGKHGKPTNETFSATYVDKYVSTVAGDGAFMGNRSIVIHFANKTRIACANFVDYTNGTSGANVSTSTNGSSSASGSSTRSGSSASGSATGSSSGSKTSSSAISSSTGAASQIFANSALVGLIGGGVALFAL